MRASIVGGLLLTAAAVLVIVLGSALDWDIEPYAVTGVLAGGVVGLVADGAPWARLAGAVIGFAAIWVGFVLRAAVLPDTTGGLVVATLVSLVICVLAAAAGRGRVPLWAVLAGAGLFAGAYESAFVAAESEVGTTSLDAATSLLFAVAVGFVVVLLAAPNGIRSVQRGSRATTAPAVDQLDVDAEGAR